MGDPFAVLILTTISTAVFHTLIPDHWLPFVLVARTEGWDTRKTALMTAGSATLHVLLSIGLGIATLGVGRGASSVVGISESISRLSSVLLVIFGVAYALWFLARGGHQHSFGIHPHHAPDPSHTSSTQHPHDLDDHAGLDSPREVAVAGGESLQPNALAASRRGALSGLSLAGIVGLNPCLLVIPYIYVAGSMGTVALLMVAGAFAVSTVVCMVGVALIGLKGTARLESPFLMKYGEVVSGSLIALTGLVLMLSGS